MPILKQVRRFLRRLFSRRSQPTQLLYEEILYLSAQTQSLEDLLTLFPQRICATLTLSSFHIFLREGAAFVVQPATAESTTFPATSSLAVRMRRDRKPALFNLAPAEPDGWQLLATPEELAALTALDAQVLVPLEGRTRLQGFVALARAAHKPFTQKELRFLADLGPQIGRGLETALLLRTLSEQAVTRAAALRELELAREVQERLLPRTLPVPAGYDAAALYRSAGPIGGDYYDLFPTPSGHLCLLIADISGKGVPAALLMATLRATLHALLQRPVAPPDKQPLATTIQTLNTLLHQSSSSSRYATLFCALLDSATGNLTTVNAGHNPPFLLRASAALAPLPLRLTRGGPVVGLLPSTSYEEESQTLYPGDTLVLYTDGVTEAFNATDEEWGELRLQHSLHRASPSARSLVAQVIHDLEVHTAATPQSDDITLLLVRREAGNS